MRSLEGSGANSESDSDDENKNTAGQRERGDAPVSSLSPSTVASNAKKGAASGAMNWMFFLMQTLITQDGSALLSQIFIPAIEADAIFDQLRHELAWSQEHYSMFGKPVTAPRLVCWYGDADAEYRYSSVKHSPLAWVPILSNLKIRVESASGCVFNSVLGNLYRDGKDSMGWHADKEKELGLQPCIASLSFGVTRIFMLRHTKSGETVRVELGHGSLLVMGGSLQTHWRHCVPKTAADVGARINLTFRRIFPASI